MRSLFSLLDHVIPLYKIEVWLLIALHVFEFFCGAGPVGAQQSRKCAVCEQLATSLAMRTVISFVRCIANALNFVSTADRSTWSVSRELS